MFLLFFLHSFFLPFHFAFLWCLFLDMIMLTQHNRLAFRNWEQLTTNEKQKKLNGKIKKICFFWGGGSWLCSDLQIVVIGVLCFRLFFFLGVFCFLSLSRELQKPPLPQNKQKKQNKVFLWFLVVFLFYWGVPLATRRAPQTNKTKKPNTKEGEDQVAVGSENRIETDKQKHKPQQKTEEGLRCCGAVTLTFQSQTDNNVQPLVLKRFADMDLCRPTAVERDSEEQKQPYLALENKGFPKPWAAN